MNQYVDWQSLKRTKVEEIVPGDLVWWFVDGNLELVVVLRIDHDLYESVPSLFPVIILHDQTIEVHRCYSLVKVVDNPNLFCL